MVLYCTGKDLNRTFGLAAKVTGDLWKSHFSSEVELEARELMESQGEAESGGMKKGQEPSSQVPWLLAVFKTCKTSVWTLHYRCRLVSLLTKMSLN